MTKFLRITISSKIDEQVKETQKKTGTPIEDKQLRAQLREEHLQAFAREHTKRAEFYGAKDKDLQRILKVKTRVLGKDLTFQKEHVAEIDKKLHEAQEKAGKTFSDKEARAFKQPLMQESLREFAIEHPDLAAFYAPNNRQLRKTLKNPKLDKDPVFQKEYLSKIDGQIQEQQKNAGRSFSTLETRKLRKQLTTDALREFAIAQPKRAEFYAPDHRTPQNS